MASHADGGDGDVGRVRGKVVHRVFHNEGNGFTILSVNAEKMGEVSVVCSTPMPPSRGDVVVAEGAWGVYKGRPQLKATSVRVDVDRSDDGIVAWLKSQNLEGVGDRTLVKLRFAFAGRLHEAVGDASALMAAVPGVRRRQAEAVAAAWNGNSRRAAAVSELLSLGLTARNVKAIEEIFGEAALRIARENPWRMCEEVEGVGFLTCDLVAERAGLDMSSAVRITAGLRWVLQEHLVGQGHTGVPRPDLLRAASRHLSLSEARVSECLDDFLDGDRIVEDADTGLVYPRFLLEDERRVARRLVFLRDRGLPAADLPAAEQALLGAQEETGISLDRDGGQWDAAMAALTEPVAVVTGGPGTGKSTIQMVVAAALARLGRRAVFAAPTGRAAKRLSETSRREALTIHRLLEFDPQRGGFSRDEARPLAAEAVVVDEFSMVDIRLAASLLAAVRMGTTLLLVGDVDQLPSVGPGQVLRDVIASSALPVVRLTRVRRQAAGSGIAMAAARVNAGLSPWEGDEDLAGDFTVLDREDEDISRTVLAVVSRAEGAGFRPLRDIQVLAAMRRGDAGVVALNERLKDLLNPVVDGDGSSVRMDGRCFTPRDRVMQVRNDYVRGVHNGEVGSVEAAGVAKGADGKEAPWMEADFSGVRVRYDLSNVGDVVHAYAVTVHKSQGCEFPLVVVACPDGHRRMLGRNLLYTAMTRARARCFLVGPKRAIARSARTEEAFRRHTGLALRLRREAGMA